MALQMVNYLKRESKPYLPHLYMFASPVHVCWLSRSGSGGCPGTRCGSRLDPRPRPPACAGRTPGPGSPTPAIWTVNVSEVTIMGRPHSGSPDSRVTNPGHLDSQGVSEVTIMCSPHSGSRVTNRGHLDSHSVSEVTIMGRPHSGSPTRAIWTVTVCQRLQLWASHTPGHQTGPSGQSQCVRGYNYGQATLWVTNPGHLDSHSVSKVTIMCRPHSGSQVTNPGHLDSHSVSEVTIMGRPHSGSRVTNPGHLDSQGVSEVTIMGRPHSGSPTRAIWTVTVC